MSNYRKIIEAGTFEQQFYESLGFPPKPDGDGVPLVIRITVGDMELLNGFYMSLPADVTGLSVEGAIRKYVICEDEKDRAELRRKLTKDPNPDLLDNYDDLMFLYEQADSGRISLSYHINNGASDIEPTDPVSLHQCEGEACRLLDVVLEIQYNLDPFAGMTDEERESMLRDFRCIFALYLMDKFGYQPESEAFSGILEDLASEDEGLISMDEGCSITPRGYDLLSSIIDEVEFYINNYDIFGDVYYARGKEEIRFYTGYGDDLIVPVLKREGLDLYRAFFIVALYFGNMDHLVSDLSMLFSEEPFRDLFLLIPYSLTEEDIGAELLERIIREGKSKVEEQKLREERVKHIEEIRRRIEE